MAVWLKMSKNYQLDGDKNSSPKESAIVKTQKVGTLRSKKPTGALQSKTTKKFRRYFYDWFTYYI